MKTNLVAIYHHPGMQTLHEALGQHDHRTLVLWALETGNEIIRIYSDAFPEDTRPSQALEAADAWSRGDIKMPLAKIAARGAHNAARDAKVALNVDVSKKAAATAAAHAMGQIIGVVHVGTHATAYAAYAVQAAVLHQSLGDPEETLSEAANHLAVRLAYWASVGKDNRPWAKFL